MRFRNNITFPYYADEDIYSDDETPDIGALSCTPGVGRYDHDVERDRQVAKKWQESLLISILTLFQETSLYEA